MTFDKINVNVLVHKVCRNAPRPYRARISPRLGGRFPPAGQRQQRQYHKGEAEITLSYFISRLISLNGPAPQIWSMKTNKMHTDLPGHTDEVWSVDFVADKIVSGGRDGAVKIWKN